MDTSTSTSATYTEPVERVPFRFDVSRRSFMQLLGAGLLVSIAPSAAQSGGVGGAGARTIAARLHIGQDGIVTVLSGKVEGGQGARTQIAQAAAEELRVGLDKVRVILADTDIVPDDGITAGSRTTPSTIPAVRTGAAAARQALLEVARSQWNVPADEVSVRDGRIVHTPTGRQLTYAELANSPAGVQAFARAPANVTLTPVAEWKVMGLSTPAVNARDIVTGRHQYPSDIVRPGMLYGRVLRPPAYNAQLTEIDLAPAQGMKDVVVVRDGQFVGVAAPTLFAAGKALEAIAATAKWRTTQQVASSELYAHLRRTAQNMPANPAAAVVAAAPKKLKQTYHIAYIQHAPMEPRAAVAEVNDGKVTVWMGSQNPFGCRTEIARALGLPANQVQVIIPDFGGGFGGKHTAEHGIEAARLAQAARKPVWLRWTRAEEFMWAYFRPAGVTDIQASLDDEGRLTSWHFVNILSGGAAVDCPYRVPNSRSVTVSAQSPLRTGSYRALAATANNFARECFIDEMAALAGQDPLQFRLAHLDQGRLRNVLEAAARRFGWAARYARKEANVGVGLACGTEKGSYVAACAEVAVDLASQRVQVRHICQVFECGKIINPDNLRAQVEGCVIMGLGAALREEIIFEDGVIQNGSFADYHIPRMVDVPEIEIELLDRPDLAPAGGSETPIIAVAPAIANAVYHATGMRIRQMPVRLPEPKAD